MTDKYDLEAYLRNRLGEPINALGGRGYDQGVRIFDCPLCGDTRGRGWVNVVRKSAGCWNNGCPAESRIGALEFVRLVEGFKGRMQALIMLEQEYPAAFTVESRPLAPRYEDWCALPPGFMPVQVTWHGHGSLLWDQVRVFAKHQWGLTMNVLANWKCGVCLTGRYAWRIVIPVIMNGQLVSFQARTFRTAEPKYLTAKHGKHGEKGAECGRPADALLFNLDAVQEGSDVALVEGAADTMAWQANHANPIVAVGLLGLALTDEKVALLAAKRPRRIYVAADADAETRGKEHVEGLVMRWGLDATMAYWKGGKDAGAGATMHQDQNAGGLLSLVCRKLHKAQP